MIKDTKYDEVYFFERAHIIDTICNANNNNNNDDDDNIVVHNVSLTCLRNERRRGCLMMYDAIFCCFEVSS